MNWNYYAPIFECDKYNKEMLRYSPWSGHRRFAYDLIANIMPKRIVELGSFYGCSFFSFAQAIKDFSLSSELYGVDVWKAFDGDTFVYEDYSEDIWRAFNEVKNCCFNLPNISALRMTFDEACKSFENCSIDILHIDGSHEYEDVRHDFETWKGKVKADGMVLFHDISPQLVNGRTMASYDYWLEISSIYPSFSFEYSYGLGVLFFDDLVCQRVQSSIDFTKYKNIFFQEEVDEKDEIRKKFFRIRDGNSRLCELESIIDNKKSDIEKYKKIIKGKDDYINELLFKLDESDSSHKNECASIKSDYEETAKEIINAYSKTISEKDMYIEELLMRIDGYDKQIQDEIEMTKISYETTLEETRQAYQSEQKKIQNSYEETILNKNAYIAELERTVNSYKIEPKISIIIPVYNTAPYIKRCLDSVNGQIYKNIELIIVNDGSTDESEKIIYSYIEKDNRIKYVCHKENKGLFQARVSGSKFATGDYIAFLDSDDYVTRDYYYSLVRKAVESNSDIVIGRTVLENEDGYREVFHHHDCATSIGDLYGSEIEENFWNYEGRCYAWHTIWNKIYSIELWNRALPFYEGVKGHIVMTEDIAFSTVLMHFAKHMSSTKLSAYFYCIRDNASTDSKKTDLKRYKKNVEDMTHVFDFVEKFLKSQKVSETILQHMYSFRLYYAKMWFNHGTNCLDDSEKRNVLESINRMEPLIFQDSCFDEGNFFDTLRIQWNDGIEDAKERILDSRNHFVSFDIFDTLIVRPLYNPVQIYELLDNYYTSLTGSNVRFSKIRQFAETIARRKVGEQNQGYEDVTIDEIYQNLEMLYEIKQEDAELMKEKEIEIELKLCKRRESIGYLFDLAKYIGKSVILISDMYLPKNIIEMILHNNGYNGYTKIYVSSDTRLLKNSGRAYDYVLKDLGAEPREIIHFGDNWQNDVEAACRKGINTFFIPKATEIFENKINGRDTNSCASLEKYAAGWIGEQETYKKSLGYGAMMSIASGYYFDNPYRLFCADSDLNIDPYFWGFYPIGMFLYGFTKWLIESARMAGYKQLCFLSRDGYLPFHVYKKMAPFFSDAPKAIYKHTSRKAIMPYIVKSASDLFAYPTEIKAQTPLSMMKLFGFCSKEVSEEKFKLRIKREGIDPKAHFSNEEEFCQFVRFFIRELYDEEKHCEAQYVCKQFFSDIDSSTAMVDMGYSARIQGAISAAVGHGVDVFFVHSDKNNYLIEENMYNFKIHSFYDYDPCVTGLFREYLLSGSEPSCIGYERKDNKVVCVFEKNNFGIVDKWINYQIKRGVEDFIGIFLSDFGDIIHCIPTKSHEISFPIEGFLRAVSDMDLTLFKESYFEDEVWGGNNSINMMAFLQNQKRDFDSMFNVVKEVDGQYVAKAKRIITRFPWVKNGIEKILDFI